MSLISQARDGARNGLIWAFLAIIGPPLWCAVVLLRSHRAQWRIVRTAGRVLCALSGVHLSTAGEIAELDGPLVVVSNHESFVDALALILALRCPVAFVAGAVLAHQRIAGPFLRHLGCVFVGEAGEPPRAALARLEGVLSSGRSLAIFPEGSLSPVPGLRRFRTGAFVVANEARRPIVPIAITGTRGVVAPGSRFVRPGSVTVSIGTPLAPRDADRAGALALASAAREAIGALGKGS